MLLVKKKEYKPSDRYAYKTNHKDPIYIPVNRIQTPYQTDEATNKYKVRINRMKMRRGEALEPIVIGYGSDGGRQADLHDGHHRLDAAKREGYTHVPCVVGGRNKRRVQAAEKRYQRIWKSIKASDGLTKSTPKGDHWITVKEGHLKGRHILIDSKGYIVGGSLPHAFHGHHIGKLKGIGTEENPYSQYEHHELKEIHGEFKGAHEANKKELHDMIHGMAQQLHEVHEERYGSPSSIANRVKQVGGIRPPQKGQAFASEYNESIPASMRRVIGSKHGRPIDEVADELGMSARELVDALSNTKHKGNLNPKHFYPEAKRLLEQMHGADEMHNRRKAIKEMESHLAKIKAAIRSKKRKGEIVKKSMIALCGGRSIMKKHRKTGGKLLIKKSGLPAYLKEKVHSGDAHWVTVKSGPLEGRHLLINGPRPEVGEKSKGKILAGHGIPPHVIEKITGATHARHLEHEPSMGPDQGKKPSKEKVFDLVQKTQKAAKAYHQLKEQANKLHALPYDMSMKIENLGYKATKLNRELKSVMAQFSETERNEMREEFSNKQSKSETKKDINKMSPTELKAYEKELENRMESHNWNIRSGSGKISSSDVNGTMEVGHDLERVKNKLGTSKQPYMRTYSEFKNRKSISREAHKKNVETALKNDYDVPQRVLDEYPELAAKYGKIGPFTDRDVEEHNRMTHFPTTKEKMNAKHTSDMKQYQEATQEKLKRYGVDNIPENVQKALDKLKEADVHMHREWNRARNVAPPWSVTGRSGYKGNHERARAIERNSLDKVEVAKKALDRAIDKHNPNRAISSDESDAIQKLQTKIDKAEKLQETYKAINKIVRNKKLSHDEKIKKMVSDLGIKEATAKEALQPDYGGRVGIPSFALQNNNANIKRMKQRVEKLNQQRSVLSDTHQFNGGLIHDNVDANRLQIFHDEKPDAETRKKLKARGFRWAPSAEGPNGEKGAWQRYRSPEATRIAHELIGSKVKKSFIHKSRLFIKRAR